MEPRVLKPYCRISNVKTCRHVDVKLGDVELSRFGGVLPMYRCEGMEAFVSKGLM